MMEFFEYFNVMLLFGGTFPFSVAIYATAIMAVMFLILFVLKGIGLHSLAVREQYRRPWLAFIPFFNDYLMGRLSGGVVFAGRKVKHLPIYYALADLFACIVYILQAVAELAFCFGGAIYDSNAGVYTFIPDTLGWAYYMQNVTEYLCPVFSLIYTFVFVWVVFSFFRRYAAKNALLFSVASVFVPIQGILVFAVRKNMPVDYSAYMHARREAQYRRYREQYGQSDRGFYERREDPFREFSEPRSDGTSGSSAAPSEFPENDEFFR